MNRIVPFKKKEFENSKGGYIEFLEVPLWQTRLSVYALQKEKIRSTQNHLQKNYPAEYREFNSS